MSSQLPSVSLEMPWQGTKRNYNSFRLLLLFVVKRNSVMRFSVHMIETIWLKVISNNLYAVFIYVYISCTILSCVTIPRKTMPDVPNILETPASR